MIGGEFAVKDDALLRALPPASFYTPEQGQVSHAMRLRLAGSRKRRDEAVRRRDRHPFPFRGRHERAAGQPAHRD